MTKPLFFKVTSDQLLLCVFLSLLWGVTDSNTTTGKTTVISSSTTPPTTTPSSTTPPTTIPSTANPLTIKPSPENVKGVEVSGQSENSISLMWDKVNNITTYLLQYEDKGSSKVENITASDSEASVTHEVSSLTAGTKYNFTLFTVFEEVNSTGYAFQAVTAPENVKGVEVSGQSENSITLMWDKVNNIPTYLLQYEDKGSPKVENITASDSGTSVTHEVSSLTAGTNYSFTLFTVFEEVNSPGYAFQAVTAPENVKGVEVSGQSENSITLMWDKVNNIPTYLLQYEDKGSPKVENITASDSGTSVTHEVSSLTAGTKYSFTLFTVFEEVNSPGHVFQAVTAPENVKGVEVSGQSENSITLMWDKVNNIPTYLLQYEDKGSPKVENITASDSGTSVTHEVSSLTAGTKYSFTLFTVFEEVNSPGYAFQAVTAPENVKGVEVSGQSENSITLMWDKVNNIPTYLLQYEDKGSPKVENITASDSGTSVTHEVSSLTAGTKYSFTLFTVFEEVNSPGYAFQAVTAPENVKGVEVSGQSENSITLMWDKVNNIPTYLLQYEDKGSSKVENITASDSGTSVTHEVSSLTAGTKYSFTLFTVFEEVNSTGYMFQAVTAPENVKGVEVSGQSENSITLMWDKVNNITTYLLQYEDKGSSKVENITASDSGTSVTHEVSSLTAGTKYSFMLFTVFEELNSTGYAFQAVTAPENVTGVEVLRQSENSITLMWDKVNNIPKYLLQYEDKGSSKVENITASDSGTSVTHEVSSLTAGTKYSFTLFTVLEKVNSTGYMFQAVTAPENVKGVEVSGQSENSITLMWDKVNNIPTYLLQYEDKGSSKVENIIASDSEASVTHEVSSLTAGTKYTFTLFTVFEEVNSTGYAFQAVTAPENVKGVEVSGQSENSITLMWDKVNNIPTYLLQYEDKGSSKVENIIASDSGASVTHEVSSLTAGTKYSFTLFTVFEEVNSTGYVFQAVTDPENVKGVEVLRQSENSITLMWDKVNNIPTYLLQYEDKGSSKVENITASDSEASVTHEVSSLTAGTKYSFTLFTVFEEVNSTGYAFQAVTAPENVKGVEVLRQSENSITLMWDKVNNIPTYLLQYEDKGSPKVENITASDSEASVTYEVSSLTAGTKYSFTLFTVFEEVNSTGYMFQAVTVPSQVTLVNVTERSTTSITLVWNVDVDKGWSYFLQMNGYSILLNTSTGVVLHRFTSLQPGRAYPFSIITQFSGLNSTSYEDYTITRIDCASVRWHVTTSSIQGMVEGLFTNATAKYKSQEHVSPGGPNVSFTGLYPGATYELYLWYENNSKHLDQCEHNLTIIPPCLNARCEHWDAGYSVRIAWDEPEGVWTAVEVNVTGKSYRKDKDDGHSIVLSGFLPAKHYEVSLTSLSGTGKGSEQHSEPFVFSCATDSRGVIAGSVFAVLLFVVLVCLVVFILLKRPDIIRRKKLVTVGSKQSELFRWQSFQTTSTNYVGTTTGVSARSMRASFLSARGRHRRRLFCLRTKRGTGSTVSCHVSLWRDDDWCRVKLTTSDPNATSDYINASYMPGYNSDREYIATQGPLPSTVNDFWRMIWEQKVTGIVMVTNCTEGGRTKCEQYWPANSDPCRYGELTVTMNSEQQEPNWTLRDFRVKHSKTSEERTVRHFHFTAWPDHGVPQGTEVLIQFRGLVRQHIHREGAGAPTVVHCSAGVGRTGTIIALDVLLQQLEKERAVGINAFVHKMRLNRPHMVQTESLYIFLHQCIMDCLLTDKKAEEHVYENPDPIYDTELQVFHTNP
ncbi:receptor-type tyrosine-protein phosphatase H-like isoform X3 [Acanthopagrus latus]|uniref:receptor-type tyrosine-protein phosphatase H-like isoform X3 n=1 Tax=Acanthopagrus latus TaxID=8177 RepID=UPI00187C2B14|nr:receptor-type tyrosine-protein phosphatase H-like isoform X3 [Acanthopagrus latus]